LSSHFDFATTAAYTAYIGLLIFKTIGSYVFYGILERVMT